MYFKSTNQQMLQVYLNCLSDALKIFMFCRPLSERTAGSDVFKAVNDYITSEDISLSNCVGICTDGAVVLTGHKKRFQAEVRQVAPHVNFIHSIVHREALASRDLQSQ
jgi:hypothetical protein